jgi:TonB family protein
MLKIAVVLAGMLLGSGAAAQAPPPVMDAAYLSALRVAVGRHQYFPPSALARGEQGRGEVRFLVARDGTISGVMMVHSAGYDDLDKAAVDMVSAASPLPPLPATFKGEKAEFILPVTYSVVRQPKPAPTEPRWVLATGTGNVPHFFICPDLERWQLLYSWYLENQEEKMQDALTGGRSKLYRATIDEPSPPALGCVEFPLGSHVRLEKKVGAVPIVSVTLTGNTFRGITNPASIREMD